jgi:PAS domain-containing protein
MSAPTARAFDSRESLQERGRVLNDGWLLMLLAAALAVGVPWFLRNVNVELAPVSWAVFLFGVAYLAFSRGLDRVTGARTRLLALTLMQMAAVVFVAFLWHLAGGLQNPLFLMLFALPVAAAGCVLPGARPYLLAALSVVCVSVVALANAPQLRWYMAQLGIPVNGLPSTLAVGGVRPFPGLEMPAAYLFLLLVTFAILIFAVALLSQSMAALLRSLYARLDTSASALTRAHMLAADVIARLPHPTVLVYSDTRNVAFASLSFVERMGVAAEALQEKGLFSLVDFAYPEVIERLVASGRSGEVPVAAYRVGGETRLARVRVAPVDHAGASFACVTIEDVAEELFRKAALEAVPDALLLVGADAKIHYFNAAAERLFPGLRLGADAAETLAQEEARDWWILGPRSQRERPVSIRGKSHAARCSALAVPGLQERPTVIRLREAAA